VLFQKVLWFVSVDNVVVAIAIRVVNFTDKIFPENFRKFSEKIFLENFPENFPSNFAKKTSKNSPAIFFSVSKQILQTINYEFYKKYIIGLPILSSDKYD